MGRTIPTFRMILEHEIASWAEYRRALRPNEQKIFDKLMNAARSRADAGGYISRPLVSEVLFISIIIDLQKQIQKLTDELQNLINEVKKTNE
ncbi:MAG: hypothetical protein ACTSO9_15715 [Candidatus Helarchaeota archaeon]